MVNGYGGRIAGGENATDIFKEIQTNPKFSAKQRVKLLDGVEAFNDKPFFDVFTIKTKVDAQTINDRLFENGILGGINIKKYNNELGDGMIIAVTEKRKKSEIDKFVEVVKEAF